MPRLILRIFMTIIAAALLGMMSTAHAVAQNECGVSTAQQMIDAINGANEDSRCKRIFLEDDISVAAGYEGGDTAFPAITNPFLKIDLKGKKIERVAGSPPFRFFLIDQLGSNFGRLTLNGGGGGSLEGGGGEELTGGAILLHARGSIKTSDMSLSVDGVKFRGNTAKNGGALAIIANSGGYVDTMIDLSTFEGNRAQFGGGTYVEAANNGHAYLALWETKFLRNEASVSGGGAYFSGWPSGNLRSDFATVLFSENRAEQAAAIFYNAKDNGRVTASVTKAVIENNVSGAADGVLDVVIDATGDGNARITFYQIERPPIVSDKYGCYAGSELHEVPCR